jgi:hypothetical protein
VQSRSDIDFASCSKKSELHTTYQYAAVNLGKFLVEEEILR